MGKFRFFNIEPFLQTPVKMCLLAFAFSYYCRSSQKPFQNMSGVHNANKEEPIIKKRKPLRENEIVNNENEELKFLEILSVIIDKKENNIESETEKDSIDGITSSILTIAERLTEILECDFESLNFPKKVIKVLKKLKGIIDFFNAKKTLETLTKDG